MTDIYETLGRMRQAAYANDFESAAVAAREVLEARPNCLPALRALGWAQISLDDDEALQTFEACANLDPEDGLAEVGQAVWYEKHEQPDRAIEHFVRACELEPHDQRIRREVVRLGGELPETPLAEGNALLHDGRIDPATAVLRQAAASSPNDAAVQLALAVALWRVGGKQQAYNLASNVLTSRPHCARALLVVLAAEAAGGRLLRTRDLYARADSVDPGLELYAEFVRELGLTSVVERFGAGRASVPGR
jgi:tetratricopeptide (TPR) repeat protein